MDSIMDSITKTVQDITYRDHQNVTRIGWHSGETHVQTGELRVYDSRTGYPVWVRPDRVFFLPND
jgi:hypothetical protein